MLIPKIKEIRERNNMSMEYVSIQMDMSIQEYDKIERGLVNLKLTKLDRLVKIIGTNKSFLFSID